MLEPMLSDRDVEQAVGRACSSLQKDRVVGTGIPFVRIRQLVRYRQSEVSPSNYNCTRRRRVTVEVGA
jgi:hypothetical protein